MDHSVWETGFRRDAENGNRDGRAPRNRSGVSAERRKCDRNLRWRLSAESRYAENRMPQGQLVAPKSDEGRRVAWLGARCWAMTEIGLVALKSHESG
jgi:hypothetical protein